MSDSKECPKCGKKMVKMKDRIRFERNKAFRHFRWWCKCGYIDGDGEEITPGDIRRLSDEWDRLNNT